MALPKALKIIVNKLPKFRANMELFDKEDVYVGVPSDHTERNDTNKVNNAVIAYTNDNGSPMMNIPARPFMRPGIENAKADISNAFKRGAKAVLKGNDGAIDIAMHQAGLIAQRSIRAAINDGIPPPLADFTIRARSEKGSKGAKVEMKRRKEGEGPSASGSAKPLIVTGQLRNSINYVIRSKNK